MRTRRCYIRLGRGAEDELRRAGGSDLIEYVMRNHPARSQEGDKVPTSVCMHLYAP